MELKEGTDVFTSSGEHVGKISRFVLHPGINQLTHIVVQKGWLLPEDKVIPIGMISSTSEDRVMLNEEIDFEELTPFEETHYVELTDDILATGYPTYHFSPSYYWYPPSGYIGYPAFGPEYYGWPPRETTRNIPTNTIPLKEGAAVVDAEGEQIGSVERLSVDPDTHRTTHFVITRGTLTGDRKLLPAHWVKTIEENKVRLMVTPRLIDRLPDYEP